MADEPRTNETSRPSVLVIDDSPDVHRLMRARLKSEDLDVLCASAGGEGMTLALDRSPSIILLDLDMPTMDGFEVLRKLKAESRTINIPVIMLSASHSSQDKVTAFDLGAVDYVTKPFDFTELRVRLKSSLRIQQLLQMLAQRAQIDGLTGLWNRAFFDLRWKEEVARALRHSRPLSVAIIDIDHFKSINDTFGHPAGDAVIQGLAKLIQREARASDVCCRYGGEEFVVIMPDTSPGDAKILAERLRTGIEGVTWPRHPERKVTMSIGITGASTATQTTAEAWLEAADKNLYSAKKGGRNRVTVTEIASPAVVNAAG